MIVEQFYNIKRGGIRSIDKKNIKIVHILNSNKYSGAENVAIQIIKICEENGIECIYASPDGPIKQVLENENVIFRPIKQMNPIEIRKMLEQENPTLIHTHDFIAGTLTAFSGTKKPIISHIHNNATWIKKPCLWSIIYYIATLKFKKILTVSESIEKEYVFGSKISNKIKMVGNPININNIKEKANLKNTINKKYDIIFLGRLTKAKNPIRFIDIIADIVKSHKKLSVAMIGDGDLKKQCIKKIEKEKLATNIDLLGFLENPYSILKNAKLLCITSNYEGYGLVAIEALTLGIPVIANNVGGLPNIIDDSCGKIVNTNKEFKFEIIKLLDNPQLLEKKKNAARDKVLNIYKNSDYKNSILKIYKEIIENYS